MAVAEYVREYEFEDTSISPVKVCQSPDPGCGLGATVWDAGLVLCAFLESKVGRSLVKGTTCVELGSGTGIVALVAEAVGAGRVIATDKQNCVSFLRQNVGLNEQSQCKVAALEWGEEIVAGNDHLFEKRVDWVLCADCVYDDSAAENLVKTIAALNPVRGIIVSNEQRTAEQNLIAEKTFISGLYKNNYFGKAVHRDVLRPEWRCDDINVVVFGRRAEVETKE